MSDFSSFFNFAHVGGVKTSRYTWSKPFLASLMKRDFGFFGHSIEDILCAHTRIITESYNGKDAEVCILK